LGDDAVVPGLNLNQDPRQKTPFAAFKLEGGHPLTVRNSEFESKKRSDTFGLLVMRLSIGETKDT
jgi:hypothetical protein